ncbi:unnamed protein product [Adineta steineri]|uniref:Anaphase-promoting complex subunit 10 n=1 Tax=Adineta steineri TaxID=433720 RepID=A0A815EY05_9BILA|nr:unnamed protein product [Adineta steineri]CAF1584522.1 unnamed protein product [Adineta steineri]
MSTDMCLMSIRVSKNNREIDSTEDKRHGILQNKHIAHWQSDRPRSHPVNIQFKEKIKIKDLCIFSDFKVDESYTPQKILIRTGINHNNLVELRYFKIHEPTGWVIVPTRDARSNPIRTWMIQIAVLANHQSGRA